MQVVPHPRDPNTLYVATGNGGIWVTHNPSPTFGLPLWTPLTDRYPSLSFTSLAFDTLPGSTTLYAGTGRASNGGTDGGPAIGLLKSTDSGLTWSQVGQNTFNDGERIRSVLPTSIMTSTGQVILVGTDSGSNPGVYRSANAGSTWTKISSGLPAGTLNINQLVADPGNGSRFYATTNGQGIFRTVDGGLNWSSVNNNISPAIIANSVQTLVTVHNNPGLGTNVVYATFKGAASSAFWSTNTGNTWTAMDTPPAFPFSAVADPTDPNVVYIGSTAGADHFRGDRSGRLGQQWERIADEGANNTSPHDDTRSMTVDLNGNILEASDGGIYRLITPNNRATRTWQSLNGNLTDVEFYSVAYDALNGTILGGAQDNGSSEQSEPGGIDWRAIGGGDGAFVAVDDTSMPGFAIHYNSTQNLRSFTRRTVGRDNALVSEVPVGLVVDNAGGNTFFDLEKYFPGSTQFEQPYVLNTIDPRRMLIGTNYLYESFNRGDNLNALGGVAPLGFNQFLLLNPIGRVDPANIFNNLAYHPMVYGGMSGGVANANLIWVGGGGNLYLRTSGTGMPSQVTTYPGSTVLAIAVDRTDWHTAVILDADGRVWRTSDAGATSANWTNLTGNLGSVPGSWRTIEYIQSVLHPGGIVLVGGTSGVYRTLDPGTNPIWTKFGNGLPHAVVKDLHYYPAVNTVNGPSGDVLLAGTFGRGAWTIPNAIPSLNTPGDLEIRGDTNFPGETDVIRLDRDANIPGVLNVFINNFATPSYSVELSAVRQITVNGLDGKDTIYIDDTFSGVPVTINHGSGTNTVNLNSSARSLGDIPSTVTVNGDGTSVYILSTRAPLSVHLQGTLSNMVYVGSVGDNTLDEIQGGVDITSSGGVARLQVDDSHHFNVLGATYTMTDGNLTRVGANGDSTSVASISYRNIANIELDGGLGLNTYNVQGTLAGSSVTIKTGHGINALGVGDTNHTLNGISGALQVNGGGIVDTLLADDSRNNSLLGTTYTLTSDHLTRVGANGVFPSVASISYQNIPNIELDGGLGLNAYNVQATAASSSVTIKTGHGINAIVVGDTNHTLNGISGALQVNGGGIVDSLQIDDSQEFSLLSTTYTLTAGNWTRVGTNGLSSSVVTIGYQNIPNLEVDGGIGLNFFNLQSTAAGSSVTLKTNAGVNLVTVADGNQTLGGIADSLQVLGDAGGETAVTLNDAGNTIPMEYDFTATTVGWEPLGAPSVTPQFTYANLSDLTLQGGSGGNTLVVQSTLTGLALVMDGGSGTNTLQGPDTDTAWQITGSNTGTFSSGVSFTSVQNLVGGAGADTFVLADGAGVTGNLDGGAGSNALDYSAYTRNVLVDLALGSATGVGGSVSNIQNITGGAGSNILVGNGGNVLTGGTGRNVLIAGATGSRLIGGGTDNILIGGTTAYDMDLASLQAIMDYWAGSDDYNTRVANLTTGNGVPLLDATTVTGNGGGNTLMGGPGLDLFYGNMGLDTIMNWDSATETFISV